MQTATERERKYDVPSDYALPAMDGAGGVAAAGAAHTHELVATYFDTEDLRLAAHRTTLRRRSGGTDDGWHLKTPGDAGARTEHRLPLGDDRADVPEELARLVRAVVRDAPLAPVARLRTHRVETELVDVQGRVLALVADDTVDAEAYGQAQRWREVEVELVDGAPDILDDLEPVLRSGGAQPAAGPSKLARVLGDRVPGQPGDDAKGGVAAVRRYARKQRDTLIANDPAVRDGDEDAVHDMRVAVRRLRSTLRTYRNLWDGDRADTLRAELKWLAERLGGVRDPQVMGGRLDKLTAGPEFVAAHERLRDRLADDLDRGRRELSGALDSERYFRLLDELDAMVDGPPARGAGRVRRRARKALRRADRRLDAADAAGPDRDLHLHEARKAHKRARYAVEIFGSPAKPLVKRLTDMQDVLGDHQDAAMTAATLRDAAGAAREAGDDPFPYGILYARQQQAGAVALADLPAVRRAVRRRKVRRWLG
jgi:CHAD domain-containing protein